jgi:hypothetical protein
MIPNSFTDLPHSFDKMSFNGPKSAHPDFAPHSFSRSEHASLSFAKLKLGDMPRTLANMPHSAHPLFAPFRPSQDESEKYDSFKFDTETFDDDFTKPSSFKEFAFTTPSPPRDEKTRPNLAVDTAFSRSRVVSRSAHPAGPTPPDQSQTQTLFMPWTSQPKAVAGVISPPSSPAAWNKSF